MNCCCGWGTPRWRRGSHGPPRTFEEFADGIGALDRQGRVYAVSAAGFLAVGMLFYTPSPPAKFRAEYDPKKYPAKALGVIRGADFSKNVFTQDEWGDYLIYRLYPKHESLCRRQIRSVR